jgi:hypothetical protein
MKTYLYLKLLIIILFTGYGPEIDKITEPSIIPDGKQGVDHKSWIFVDELIIE